MQPPARLAKDGTGTNGIALSKNELKYMRASCGKTSYVTYPNKSLKILKDAQRIVSKILTKLDPLEENNKPIDGLSGPLLNEMRQLHHEKQTWKQRKVKKPAQQICREEKLSAKVFHQTGKNNNLLWSPADEYVF